MNERSPHGPEDFDWKAGESQFNEADFPSVDWDRHETELKDSNGHNAETELLSEHELMEFGDKLRLRLDYVMLKNPNVAATPAHEDGPSGHELTLHRGDAVKLFATNRLEDYDAVTLAVGLDADGGSFAILEGNTPDYVDTIELDDHDRPSFSRLSYKTGEAVEDSALSRQQADLALRFARALEQSAPKPQHPAAS